MTLIEECCFNEPRDYCPRKWQGPCVCGCHTEQAIRSSSVNYHVRDWDKQVKEGTVASHILRIPELGNAELKLTVDVERIRTKFGERLADRPAELPGFAQLRPVRVDIYLGGEHVYHWARDMVEAEDPQAAVPEPAILGGAAPAKRSAAR